VAVNHELGKVPRYVSNFSCLLVYEAVCVFAQIFEYGVGLLAVDLALVHQREFGLHVFAGILFNLFVRAGFLVEELVAREGNDLKTVHTILVEYIDQLNVTLVGERSLGCYVYEYG